MSPADQVKAVVDAVRAGRPPFGDAGAVAARPAGGGALEDEAALPRYAAELAAAVAAVEELDVLSDELDFGALADRLMRQAGAAPAQQEAPAAAATAAAAPTQAAPAQPQSVPAEEQPKQQGDEGSSLGAAPAPAPPPGPRPVLVPGSDDIIWVNELHRALVGAGYYPGDDDVEDFFFGDTTLSAVLTLQVRPPKTF
jgi:hypothetical protein